MKAPSQMESIIISSLISSVSSTVSLQDLNPFGGLGRSVNNLTSWSFVIFVLQEEGKQNGKKK